MPAGFPHLPYVNPDAPKGGTLVLSRTGTFSSFNPYTLKGTPAKGLNLVFESLLARSPDEPFTLYALLAKSVETPPDRSWVEFTLDEGARFQDGSPVTIEDIVFSFETLRDKGRPNHRTYYSNVSHVETSEPGKIRFVFGDKGDRELALIMALKINGLARGHSGVRPEVIDALLALYNTEAYPLIPGQGSVGASGDLAPLAHLSAVLLGYGEVRMKGKKVTAKAALKQAGLAPMELHAKEGLALLNGTQVSTALALDGLFSALDLFAAALTAGALSVDAALGSDTPFDPRIHALRGQTGQILSARILASLLAGSEIRTSHLECDRVQDPYSLRCQPQVMGAALDVLAAAAKTLVQEANAVSDNPLVFPDSGEILSGGNFHAEPVAMIKVSSQMLLGTTLNRAK